MSVRQRAPIARAVSVLLLVGCPFVIPADRLCAVPPSLDRVTPWAVQPGETVELRLNGKGLGNVHRVWSTFPARCELISTEPIPEGESVSKRSDTEVICRMTLGLNEAPGVGALRVVSQNGVSQWQLVCIDDLATESPPKDNGSHDKAELIKLPTAVEASLASLGSHYYQFHASSGEPLSLEVMAQRLGSPLDPVLELFDPHGKSIASSDDTPGIGADCRLACQLPTTGHYVISVRDVRYRGGADFRYRLRAGRFPLVTIAYPLGGTHGSVTEFQCVGDNLRGIGRQRIAFSTNRLAPRSRYFAVWNQGETGAGFARIAEGDGTELLEQEPNNDIEHASDATMCDWINGRCDSRDDVDYYRLRVGHDQQIVVTAATRSLGSPADLVLRVLDGDGQQVGQSDDEGSDEGMVSFSASAGKDYYLVLEELLRNAGAEFAYRIGIERSGGSFTLAADSDLQNPPQHGEFVTKVTARRYGYDGPIRLRVVTDDNVLVTEENVIPKGKNETTMRVALDNSVGAGELLLARIIGDAEIDGSSVTAVTRFTDVLKGRMPDARHAPRFLDEQIAIGVAPPLPDFFQVAVDDSQVAFAETLGVAKIRITAQRLASEFKDPIRIAVAGLPDGCEVEAPEIAKESLETIVTIRGVTAGFADAAVQITATGEYLHQRRHMTLDSLAIVPTAPLHVWLEGTEELQQGGRAKVTLRAIRFGGDPAPIHIRWAKGPSWLLVPPTVELPADQDRVEFEVAAVEAEPKHAEAKLQVIGTTQVNDETVEVASHGLPVKWVPRPPDETPPENKES